MKHGALLWLCAMSVAFRTSAFAATSDDVRVLPRPQSVERTADCTFVRHAGLTVPRGVDPGAREIVDERWRATGLPALRPIAGRSDVGVAHGSGAPASYALRIDRNGVRVESPDADGAFYAFATLAQLAQRRQDGSLVLPCVRIVDRPALRWRILSDDVSRGPLPTMRYFKERIRTIAAFKMNGYSPYMEHVFASPRQPLPAGSDGITPAQLHELAAYARRFHVALVPEQQTFAHMHNTLRWERYAELAELPHGYLLSPAESRSDAYVRDLIDEELAAAGNPPFFHIGSDEPSDLGRGRSAALVAERGVDRVYADHVLAAIALVARPGTRPMLWDDAVQAHPEIFALFPRSLVFINWHYGSEKTFMPYIERIARAGFDQMVAPGADNWNEIYPNLDVALTNIDRFITEGKAFGVLGAFQTVWHDDGESLYEATWYPVLYAAVSAWEKEPVARARYARDFPLAFFGADDAGYGADFASLARARTLLAAQFGSRSGDYLFWADPLDAALPSGPAALDAARGVRLAAEDVLEHLRRASAPPLHANASSVLAFAAERYDTLGRALQIAHEARGYYADAVANVGKNDDYVYRGLYVTKYLFWELRDAYAGLERSARDTWEYESRPAHEASVLERYHLAAQRAIARADAVDRTAVEIYERQKTLPPFDTVLPAYAATPAAR